MNRKNDIINTIANDVYYIDYCKKLLKTDIANDLYQYVMLYLCGLSEEKLVEIEKGNIKGYVTRIIYLNAYFPKSPFQQQEKSVLNFDENINFIDISDEIIEDDNKKEDYQKAIKVYIEKEISNSEKLNIYPFDVNLFNLFKQEGSIRKVAIKTKIPYPTVHLHIKKSIEEIKKIHENISNY